MHVSRKAIFTTTLMIIAIFLLGVPVSGNQTDSPTTGYSETTNAVLLRLEGLEPVEQNQEVPELKPAPEPEIQIETGSSNKPTTRESENTSLIQGIPDFGDKTIMERLQEDTTIKPGQITTKIDSAATNMYLTVVETFAGVVPLILLGGAFLLFFSRGKLMGLVLALIVAMFIIFNAPDITKMLINMVTGILN